MTYIVSSGALNSTHSPAKHEGSLSASHGFRRWSSRTFRHDFNCFVEITKLFWPNELIFDLGHNYSVYLHTHIHLHQSMFFVCA